MSVEDDAGRLLFLISFVAARGREGASRAELAALLGVSEKRLLALLEAGSMVGVPDGSPDEYVDLVFDDDRVHVSLPQHFGRPVRFSVREAWALLLALSELTRSPMPALRERALELRRRLLELSSQRASTLAPLGRGAAEPEESGDLFATLERAVSERLTLEIEYWSKSRDSFGAREIEPCLLLTEDGAWYVLGSDEKTYRVERIKRATLTGRSFEASVDVEALRTRAFGTGTGTGAARFVVLERGERRELPGVVNASVHAYLREGRGARVLMEPTEARARFLEETRALLARYEKRS